MHYHSRVIPVNVQRPTFSMYKRVKFVRISESSGVPLLPHIFLFRSKRSITPPLSLWATHETQGFFYRVSLVTRRLVTILSREANWWCLSSLFLLAFMFLLLSCLKLSPLLLHLGKVRLRSRLWFTQRIRGFMRASRRWVLWTFIKWYLDTSFIASSEAGLVFFCSGPEKRYF